MTKQLRFKMTCSACPEQYDVFWGARQVGYVRLRHGCMSASCPDVGGVRVYEANPDGDGCFNSPEERDYHLRCAGEAILKWVKGGATPSRPPAPDIEYTLEDFSEPFGD